MKVLAFSVPLHLFYITTAFFLEAIQQPGASTLVMWAANLLNLVLNLLLVPRYGALGSAFATLGARLFLACALGAWVLAMKEASRYGTRAAPQEPAYAALLSVGAAAALSQAAEAGAFSGMTVLAGRLGEGEVSAYQVILNLLAVVFMVALGFATATSVLVSEAVGRDAPREASRASAAGLLLNALLMLVAGLIAAVFPSAIARAYTADATLAGRCAELFPWTAAIVLPDGCQVVAAAALRARGDNWFPTASHLLAYALVMPALAYFLAEARGGGTRGLLAAMFAASVLSAGVLLARLYALSRQPSAERRSPPG
jgi:MATE family multidrug resistance protein